jgi:site-specific DNA-methyltransferase (adenine-specific)
MWEGLGRVCKPGAAKVFTAQTPFDKILGASNVQELKYEWIWYKNKASGHLNANRAPLKNHENVLVFCKTSTAYHPQMTEGHRPMNYALRKKSSELYGASKPTESKKGSTLRFPKTVLEIPVLNNDSPDRIHPTQKPVELMAYLIRTYTSPGDVVLDFAMGSGSTGVACILENRSFIGVEKEKEHFENARDRINKHEIFN